MVWGHPHWEQMWLADWLVLANGEEVADYIPLPKDSDNQDEYVDMPPLIPLNELGLSPLVSSQDQLRQKRAEESLAHAAQMWSKAYGETPPRPVGTKFKWVLNDQTYRIAIVTKTGVLQVKAVTDNVEELDEESTLNKPAWNWNYAFQRTQKLKQEFFFSEQSWLNSLPKEGKVTVYAN